MVKIIPAVELLVDWLVTYVINYITKAGFVNMFFCVWYQNFL
jgi:hypothetical protein